MKQFDAFAAALHQGLQARADTHPILDLGLTAFSDSVVTTSHATALRYDRAAEVADLYTALAPKTQPSVKGHFRLRLVTRHRLYLGVAKRICELLSAEGKPAATNTYVFTGDTDCLDPRLAATLLDLVSAPGACWDR